MKLILCTKCWDVIKLHRQERSCNCGECAGYYASNGLNAYYWGKHAVPLGFANISLAFAINGQPNEGRGQRFEAFVIPKKCPTMEKVK